MVAIRFLQITLLLALLTLSCLAAPKADGSSFKLDRKRNVKLSGIEAKGFLSKKVRRRRGWESECVEERCDHEEVEEMWEEIR